MATQFNGRNGTEHVVLNIAAFLTCVSESLAGKVLDLNTKLILLGKWPRSLPIFRRALLVFFVYIFSNCGLAVFHSEVTNRQYRISFECKLTRLKRES